MQSSSASHRFLEPGVKRRSICTGAIMMPVGHSIGSVLIWFSVLNRRMPQSCVIAILIICDSIACPGHIVWLRGSYLESKS